MTTRELPKAEWRPYFDLVSRHLPTTEVELEVHGLDLGDQIEAEWLPFLGLVYDPAANVVEVAAEGLDHPISGVQSISIVEQGGALRELRIVDGSDNEQVVRLRRPLQLPAPARR